MGMGSPSGEMKNVLEPYGGDGGMTRQMARDR